MFDNDCKPSLILYLPDTNKTTQCNENVAWRTIKDVLHLNVIKTVIGPNQAREEHRDVGRQIQTDAHPAAGTDFVTNYCPALG